VTRDEAQREIGVTADLILGGSLSYIEGARKIAALRFTAGLDDDPDVLPFVCIDSETDALPFGPIRELWNPDSLAKLQAEIDRAEIWAREFGHSHCANLLARFLDKISN